MPDQPNDDKTPREPAPLPPREAPPAYPRKGDTRVGREAGPRVPASGAAPRASEGAESAPESKPGVTESEPGAQPEVAAPDAGGRDVLRRQWRDEAEAGVTAHDKKVRSFLLRLSLLNWGIAIVAWTVSAALGITSPASIIVYSVLFVIGLVAAILAILTYLLEKFGHEARPIGPISGGEADGGSGDDAEAAQADTAAPAAT